MSSNNELLILWPIGPRQSSQLLLLRAAIHTFFHSTQSTAIERRRRILTSPAWPIACPWQLTTTFCLRSSGNAISYPFRSTVIKQRSYMNTSSWPLAHGICPLAIERQSIIGFHRPHSNGNEDSIYICSAIESSISSLQLSGNVLLTTWAMAIKPNQIFCLRSSGIKPYIHLSRPQSSGSSEISFLRPIIKPMAIKLNNFRFSCSRSRLNGGDPYLFLSLSGPLAFTWSDDRAPLHSSCD